MLMVDDRVKRVLADIHGAGVAAASGWGLIVQNARFTDGCLHYADGDESIAWPIPVEGRLLVVGAGKAAASLARGLEHVLGDRIDDGCVIVKYGHGEALRRIRIVEAAHPIPDAASVAGTEQVAATLRGLRPQDRVIVVLTGGASALLVAPVEPLLLADKARASDLLIACGASIEEINTVRRRLSKVKGGGLLAQIEPACSLTLAISDVPSRDIAMIGSGPSVQAGALPGDALAVVERYGLADALPAAIMEVLRTAPSASRAMVGGNGAAKHRYLILADSNSALAAAGARAAALGYAVTVIEKGMQGDTHDAARAFARSVAAQRGKPTALLAAGETTLRVSGQGRGGRNQEFALVSALELAGITGVAMLASGTDGTDGPTEAAGAFVDGSSARRAEALGIDPRAALADNDSNTLFAALEDLHVTGPTGTNVMDLVVGVTG